MNSNTKILLFGDICPTADTISFFENSDEKGLFNNLLEEMQASDYVVGNLEFVLSDNPKPIQKAGPVLAAKTECINLLKQANFKLLSLANNHIKDCGEEGVASTINTCKKANIATLGAAENLKKAKEPFISVVNGIKIGWISFAEQEFNCASEKEYGSNYFDPLEDLDLIDNTKSIVDYLIVIYHGGAEYYPYPSPLLKKKCRKFIDKGADLVTCQHSHCIGTIDNYNNKTIIYGQGNSVFGYRNNNPSWNNGLVIELQWNDNTQPKLNLIPIEATDYGIKKMDESSANLLLADIRDKSIRVNDDIYLERSWIEFCKSKQSLYLPYLFGFNRILIHLNRFTNNRLFTFMIPKFRRKVAHNMIRCEAHHEVLNTILDKINK